MCCIENDAQGLRGVYQLVLQTIPQYLSQLGNLNNIDEVYTAGSTNYTSIPLTVKDKDKDLNLKIPPIWETQTAQGVK